MRTAQHTVRLHIKKCHRDGSEKVKRNTARILKAR